MDKKRTPEELEQSYKRSQNAADEHKGKAIRVKDALEFAESIIDTVREPLLVLDADLRVISANRCFYQTFKVRPEETSGQLLYDLSNRQWDIPKLRELLEEIIPENVAFDDYEVEHEFETIGRRIMHLNARRIYRETNETQMILLAIEDVSERKRAEEKLKDYSERLEEMVEERTKELLDAQEQLVRKEKLAVLGQLAGGVGHELRNPLGVISNSVYYLKMVLPDADKKILDYLGTISSEVNRSTEIVSDLVNFSRTKPAEKERIEVSELIVQVLERHSPSEKVEVTTQVASDLPLVFVDARQIGQVLDNLVTNAYQAMPEGGKLPIKAKAEEDKVLVSFMDTGCGISQENMKKLFEPLFTTKAKGMGLGLAVSKNLVEASGGSIEVESEEGKGSTFTVILPTKEVQE